MSTGWLKQNIDSVAHNYSIPLTFEMVALVLGANILDTTYLYDYQT